MREYKSGNCIGRDEEDYNKIFLNRPNRYVPFDLEYKKHILPYLLKQNMIYLAEQCADIEVLPRKSAIKLVEEHFLPVLSKCIEDDATSLEQHADFEIAWDYSGGAGQIVKKYKKRKNTLSGWLAQQEDEHLSIAERLNSFSFDFMSKKDYIYNLLNHDDMNVGDTISDDTEENKEDRQKFLRIMYFFSVIDEAPEFRPEIPESMYEGVKEFLKLTLKVLAQGYMANDICDLVDKIEFKKPSNPLSEKDADLINTKPGIRMGRDILILNGFEFKTKTDMETLQEFLRFENRHLLYGVCFQNCLFDINGYSFHEVFGALLFQSCAFKQKFKIGIVLDGKLEFDDCLFKADLDLSRLQLDSLAKIYVFNSRIEKGACLNLSEIHTTSDSAPFITIEDTRVYGNMLFNHIKDEMHFDFKNIFFSGLVKSEGSKIAKTSHFENLGFPTQYNSDIEKSRKELYETLKASGLEDTAKELDILPQVKENAKKGKIDIDEYQVAYDSGQLNTEFAAYLLGRTPNYLAKKRVSDKKQITRDSLPFIGEGKNITYPVEVLLAFKAKDWNRLKELRQKYPIPKDEN